MPAQNGGKAHAAALVPYALRGASKSYWLSMTSDLRVCDARAESHEK